MPPSARLPPPPIPLVDYSDSDSDSNDSGDEDTRAPPAPTPIVAPAEPSQTIPLKRNRFEFELGLEPETGPDGISPRLPPPPASFHDQYFANPRMSTTDDPSLHGGRTRAVPHRVGNWPTHVQLEWRPASLEYNNLQALVDAIIKLTASSNPEVTAATEVTSLLLSSFQVPLPLHISLSQSLQIKTEDRDNFVGTLEYEIRSAGVKPFRFTFSSLKWVPNYNGSRWFLVLGIGRPKNDELNRLLNACNIAAERCGHPALYANVNRSEGSSPGTPARKVRRPSTPTASKSPAVQDRTNAFHISIASRLTEPSEVLKSAAVSHGENWLVKRPQGPLEAVKVMMGNTIHNIPLNPPTVDFEKEMSILGYPS